MNFNIPDDHATRKTTMGRIKSHFNITNKGLFLKLLFSDNNIIITIILYTAIIIHMHIYNQNFI